MNKALYFFIFSTLLSPSAQANISKETLHTIKPPKSWKPVDVQYKSEIIIALQPKSQNSSFTLREFNNPDPSLKKNVVAWMRDYKAYGFKILSNKPVKLNTETYGYLIQAVHKKSKKVFKQYMSIKNKKLAVITCHSDKSNNEFKECSDSLTSFRWTGQSRH